MTPLKNSTMNDTFQSTSITLSFAKSIAENHRKCLHSNSHKIKTFLKRWSDASYRFIKPRNDKWYVTCTSGTSPDIFESNVFDFSRFLTNDETNESQIRVITKSEWVWGSNLSFVSVSEIYKYVDEAESIIREATIKTLISEGSVRSFVLSRNSFPESLVYENDDTETIKREFAQNHNFHS